MSGKRWGPQKPFSCIVRERVEWAAQRGCEYDNPGWNTAQGEPGTRSVTHFNCWALYLRDIQQNSSTLGGNEEGDVEGGRPTAAAADSIEDALKALTAGSASRAPVRMGPYPQSFLNGLGRPPREAYNNVHSIDITSPGSMSVWRH